MLKMLQGSLTSRFDLIARKITDTVDQLEVLMESAEKERTVVIEKVAELEHQREQIEEVLNRSGRLKNNLTKLFE